MSWRRFVDLSPAVTFSLLPAAFLLVAELIIGVRWQYQVSSVLVIAIVGLLVWGAIARADGGAPLSREHLLKSITLVGAAIAAIAATGAFFESARREQQKDREQLSLASCLEVTKITATLASTYDPSQVPADTYTDFWKVFFGPLIMTENKEMADSMRRLGDDIVAHTIPGSCWKPDEVKTFRHHAVDVVLACRGRTSGQIAVQDFVPEQLLGKSLGDFLNKIPQGGFPGSANERGQPNVSSLCHGSGSSELILVPR
jgi:hypothetical protein